MKKRPKFVIRRAANKEFYGQFIAANGKEVWRTSETYKRRSSVVKAVLELYGPTVSEHVEDAE